MRYSTLFSLVAIVASASAQITITGQYDCITAGAYTLCQNLWGEGKLLQFTLCRWT